MAIVYIEPRPKGRLLGSHIEDYVVEDSADQVLATFKVKQEAIEGEEERVHTACHLRSPPQRQEKK
jgi:hypothetical protein